MIGKVTVTEAGKVLHVSDQYIRVGMQRNILPLGSCIQIQGKRWTYNIVPKKLADYAGIEKKELEQILEEIRSNN